MIDSFLVIVFPFISLSKNAVKEFILNSLAFVYFVREVM